MDKIQKDVVKACKREIDMATFYIGFYQFKGTKLTTDEAKATNALKIKQMEDASKSNSEALELLNEYIKTL